MKKVIAMTAFRRPEMLWHALENVRLAEGVGDCLVLLSVDNHHDEAPHPDIYPVVNHFSSAIDNFKWRTLPVTHSLHMSRNTLKTLRWAIDEGAELVMLVESDVMVTRDFIRWSEAVHKKFKPFAVNAWTAGENKPNMNPEDIRFGRGYGNVGASFMRAAVEEILEHDRDEYYADPAGYLTKEFSEFGPEGAAAAGIICRMVKRRKALIAGPLISRCFHAGVWGHFRNREPMLESKTLAERIAEFGERMKDEAWMTRTHKGCRPCPLEVPPWTELREWVRP